MSHRRQYTSPALLVHGGFGELTLTVQGGAGFDGGVQPCHKTPGTGANDPQCSDPTDPGDVS